MYANRNRVTETDAADFAVPAAANYTGLAVDQEKAVAPHQPDSGSDGAALQFLKALFGAKPAELFILVWRLADKCSRWFRDITEAVAYVQQSQETDMYAGVALSPEDHGRHNRCKAEETAGMPALWIDLDYQSPAHKKQNLPPTMQDASELVPPDMPPSFVIHSGHGLQAWWIFPELWIFGGPEERHAAAALADDWKLLFKQRAGARGWGVDSVADLARVMRISGTTNTKVPEDPRPVEIVEMNDRRYDPQGIRAYLDRNLAPSVSIAPQLRAEPGPAQAVVGEDIVLDPAAEPPFLKFDLLCGIELKFRASWENQRPDMQDKSASAFDLSLADYAAQARWTSQEIANLLIAHRRKHGHELKLRLDYVRRTIGCARASADQYWREQKADEVLRTFGSHAVVTPAAAGPAAAIPAAAGPAAAIAAAAMPAAAVPAAAGPAAAGQTGISEAGKVTQVGEVESEDLGARRNTIVSALATKFRVPIKRIIKFTGDDPRYRLETELGNVQLGNVNGLIAQGKLRSSIAASTGKYLPHFDPDDWPALATLLLDACEEVDRGQDATLTGTMTEWLRAYFDHKHPHASIEEADEGREPFLHNGAVYLFSGDFRRWLGLRFAEKIPQNQLTTQLRTFGAAPESFSLTVKGKTTTRSAWKLPAGTWEPAPEKGDALPLY